MNPLKLSPPTATFNGVCDSTDRAGKLEGCQVVALVVVSQEAPTTNSLPAAIPAMTHELTVSPHSSSRTEF